MKEICSSCFEPCGIRVESGEFDADGPAGTIKGNHGDTEVSDCCGESTNEINADLYEYWEELKRLAEEQDVEWLVSDDPGSHQEAFEDGTTAQDELQNQIDAASMSL